MVVSTFPEEAKAREVARALVDERLAACVTIVPRVTSIYRWDGAVHEDAEALAVIKTTSDRVEAMRARLIAMHPNQVPEAIDVPVIGGHAPYLAWVTESTS